MSTLVTAAAIVMTAASASALGPEAAERPFQTDVFVSGTGGYHTYRIPALIVTKKGTVLAFCEGRKTSRSDQGDIDLMLRRSTDGGKTWGPMSIVHEEGGTKKITIGNPCPLVDRSNGTIWLPFTRNNRRVFLTKSTDDGKTWAKPLDITEQAMNPAWHWVGTGPGHGIQLRSGRLLVPCWADATPRLGEIQLSYVFYSDDHGASWTLAPALDPNASDECEVVELVDGTLYMNMRSRQGKNRRAYAYSKDGGETWSPVKFDARLPEPSCQGSVVRFTDARRHDRNRVLLSNPASTKRARMTVRLSYDEGKTWPISKLIYKGSAAYSCLTVLPDTRIGLLYERDDYKKITFTAFTLAWLTERKDTLKPPKLAPPEKPANRRKR